MANDNEQNSKRDFRQDLTNRIIELVEKGDAPWQKPWNPDNAGAALDLPHNMATGHLYRGGNTFWLMAQGYNDPRWCTYKQAQEKGWQVRKGEKAATVEYWQFEKEEERINSETGKTEKVKVRLEHPRCFYAKVFNASQMDNVPVYEPKQKPDWDPNEKAERILVASGVPIHYNQQDRAFYRPSADSIHMPSKSAFENPGDFYEVALHELGHATGHESRLNRDLSGTFGSESYAREELRAQMASLYLAAEIGIPFNPERHASYQASWLKVLKDDRHEFFRAARDAELIADYVIELDQKLELTLEDSLKRESLLVDIPDEDTFMGAWAYLDTHHKEAINREASPFKAKDNYPGMTDEMLGVNLGSPKMKGLYTGEIIGGWDELILQKTHPKTFVIHHARHLDKTPETGSYISIEYNEGRGKLLEAKDRTLSQTENKGKQAEKLYQPENKAKQIGKSEFDELTRLKNETVGKDAKLYMARENNNYSNYTGTIVAETGSYIVQKLSDKSVVVHEKTNLNKDVEVGENASIVYYRGLVQVFDPSQKEQEKSHLRELERNSSSASFESEQKQSFHEARQSILKKHGKDVKIYDANVNEGNYRGQVVFINDKHVVQQLGANTFICHDKSRLSGEYHKDKSVQIQYNNQKASSTELGKSQDKKKEQGISR